MLFKFTNLWRQRLFKEILPKKSTAGSITILDFILYQWIKVMTTGWNGTKTNTLIKGRESIHQVYVHAVAAIWFLTKMLNIHWGKSQSIFNKQYWENWISTWRKIGRTLYLSVQITTSNGTLTSKILWKYNRRKEEYNLFHKHS